MSKPKFKEGFVARPHGPSSCITNKELTQELAVYCLESGAAKAEDFEVLPEGYGEDKPKANKKDETTKVVPPQISSDEIQAALKAFDPKGEKAYDEAKALVKELKLAPVSNKKPDVLAVVIQAQEKANQPAV